ncbi:hypothetical protein E4T44_00088 [Aureobasidium sp. EXF-8845]|nr:hypothetical protein E4T44_00088 [Aureobasidium sp. EXF-8845]KAI4858268.1 hypothetical protein E4T45_00216 [Aureobasidium sp. EXF-8846]
MDFDDELIAKLHAPERRRTPTPSTEVPPTTTSTPDSSILPSVPRPSTTTKDNNNSESYYIKPIPSGLRGTSLTHLLTLCHTHTLAHGFDVVKKAGVKPTLQKGGRKTILPNASYYKWHIACVLGGKPKNTRHLTDEQRRRDKGSLKQGCSSRVWAWAVDRENPETSAWEIRWGDTDPALHNHPPVDVRTLPNHRRRAREGQGVKEAIQECARRGLKRKEALGRLRELFPEGLFSDKDVANELQKYKGLRGEVGQEGNGETERQGQEEEMEDVEDVEDDGDETERQLQVQLQAQTGMVQQGRLQQQHMQQMQQSTPTQMLQQPTQQMQQPQEQQIQTSQQQQQQHQQMFAPGVPAYW